MKKLIAIFLVLTSAFLAFAEETAIQPRVRVVKVPTNISNNGSSSSNSITKPNSNRDESSAQNSTSNVIISSDERKSDFAVSVVKTADEIEDVIVRTNSQNIPVSKEEERKKSPVKLYWSLGLDILLPVKNEWVGDMQKSISLGPNATIGMLIKDMAYLSISAIPTFVQYKERIPVGEGYDIKYAKMKYRGTDLELNLGVDFPWGDIDTLIGFAAGVDADSFKNFYIMPNARFGYKVLGALKPVLDSIGVTVGGKYTIPSKEWEIKIGVIFSGLY